MAFTILCCQSRAGLSLPPCRRAFGGPSATGPQCRGRVAGAAAPPAYSPPGRSGRSAALLQPRIVGPRGAGAFCCDCHSVCGPQSRGDRRSRGRCVRGLTAEDAPPPPPRPGGFLGDKFFFPLVKKPGLGLVALCLQPPSVTLQSPSVTLQPRRLPSIRRQLLSSRRRLHSNRRRLPFKCHRLELCRFC